MVNKIKWSGICFFFIIVFFSCKKNDTPATNLVTPDPVIDPAVANTIGFFLDDWSAKTYTSSSYTDTTAASGNASVTVTINPSSVITKIPESIYGNNANIFMTQMVTESGLHTDLKNLNPHVIRFPGGSLSDIYFWNANVNAPPADAPAQLLDASGNSKAAGYWYGKNADYWTLSVDNYYLMLQQTGNQGMITVNYGYARYGTGTNPVSTAAHLAADWVRYDNGRTKYWEIGNENFGNWEAGNTINLAANKDGQPKVITGALYGQHFKVFADSMHKAASEIGKTIYISSVLVEKSAGTSGNTWDNGVLSAAGNSPDYYSVHSYFTPYQENSTVAAILGSAASETYTIMSWMKTMTSTAALTQKPIALTEWNINADGSMQKVSYINGIHATLLLGEALTNKFGLACCWDLANAWDNGNDHRMFSAGDETGIAKWAPRPAFYYIYYFHKMMGDRLVTSSVTGSSSISAYASSFSSGQTGSTLVNTGTTAQTVSLSFLNFTTGSRYYWYILTGGTDNGEFSRQVYINSKGPGVLAGGPSGYATLTPFSASAKNGVKLLMPARSVVYVVVDK